MKVLTFSRLFPTGHPKAGMQTRFVEKIWNNFRQSDHSLPAEFSKWISAFPFKSDEYLNAIKAIPEQGTKYHTIRSGSRWKAGDMASLRVWSDKPYRSKQIEFAQVDVKRVWDIKIHILNGSIGINVGGVAMKGVSGPLIAKNDGLEWIDFVSWFNIHPKKKHQLFTGQIICWSDAIDYSPLTSKVNA